MCFSAEASFVSGALLAPAGAYCIWAALRKQFGYLPMAAIPIFFGVQQFAEGIVWVGLHSADAPLVRGAALFYLFFALAFWPFWIPFCVLFVEDRQRVKRRLMVVTVIGLAFGSFLFGPLAVSGGDGLTTTKIHHSLYYNLRELPPFTLASRQFWQVVYVALIFCPFAVSRSRRFSIFGILLAVATGLSLLVFRYAFVSVWCFFAALLSLHLCYIFYRLEKPPPTPA